MSTLIWHLPVMYMANLLYFWWPTAIAVYNTIIAIVENFTPILSEHLRLTHASYTGCCVNLVNQCYQTIMIIRKTVFNTETTVILPVCQILSTKLIITAALANFQILSFYQL